MRVEFVESAKKEPLPQFNERTGLCRDYLNALSHFASAYIDKQFSPDQHVTFFFEDVTEGGYIEKKFIVQKYLEKFPPEKFVNVLNDKSREVIPALDTLVDDINADFFENIVPLIEKGRKSLTSAEEERVYAFTQKLTQVVLQITQIVLQGN